MGSTRQRHYWLVIYKYLAKRGMSKMSWIDAAIKSWKSPVYSHYDVTLRRDVDDDNDRSPSCMVFIFTCKTDPVRHKAHYRPHEKTSEGTANLKIGADKCNERNGVVATSVPNGTGADTGILIYSVAAHRALIALRCAKNHRPFNSVLDEDYQMEVQMLRPGTVLPHPITISRDVRMIYVEMAKKVRDYFKVSFQSYFCTVLIRKLSSTEIIQYILSWTVGRHQLWRHFSASSSYGTKMAKFIVPSSSLSGKCI